MSTELWPALRVEDWTATRDTLHMWTQVVGKIRMASEPLINHWWQVPLYVSARGLTTSSMPYAHGAFDMEFDFVEHRLDLRASTGGQRSVPLESRPVADFYAETMAALGELGVDVTIRTTPTEVVRAIPFEQDHEHTTYEPAHARAFWGQLINAQRVLTEFRSRFTGKVSPVHFFWGGLDMACTRFSGRTAPPHPGGAPNCADWVMVEGYSHELSSAGFWPGFGEEGAFYAYAYPEPPGFREHPVAPAEAAYVDAAQQFLLPYEAVRRAADPDRYLLEFLQSTYEAAADNGQWDRDALEADPTSRARS
ncbi:DUF5996 family protein [Actinomycetospora chibensis]|uniref:DUF5996 family protein n=1 Tax=Actinomycetospora chibensis TaxID=663606 RepID=A0ABV9RCK7_9PSEU|nr:DUF5996 family protein [Actinomycetospora chibensis]MDD7926348.1 DUF5996 family protein [Actinomycetospora chibensis]